MIKVSNKDSIIDIIKKIESSKKNEIVLEFPIWNSILHNYTSLKILKNKVKNKNLVIVTSDVNAKKIWKNLWIKFSIIKDEEHWSKNCCSIKTGPSGREDENIFKPRYGCLGTIIMKKPRIKELKRDLHMNSPIILNDTAAKIYKELQQKKKI